MGFPFTNRVACHGAVLSVMETVDDTVGVVSGLFTEPRNSKDCGGSESAVVTLALEACAVELRETSPWWHARAKWPTLLQSLHETPPPPTQDSHGVDVRVRPQVGSMPQTLR